MFRTMVAISSSLALTLTAACGGGPESYTDGDPDRPVIAAAATSATATPPAHSGDVPMERITFSAYDTDSPVEAAPARRPRPSCQSSEGPSIACAGCHPEAAPSTPKALRWAEDRGAPWQ
jgi:hypothetical protein